MSEEQILQISNILKSRFEEQISDMVGNSVSGVLTGIQSKVANLKQANAQLKEQVNTLLDKVTLLESKVDNLASETEKSNQYSRRNFPSQVSTPRQPFTRYNIAFYSLGFFCMFNYIASSFPCFMFLEQLANGRNHYKWYEIDNSHPIPSSTRNRWKNQPPQSDNYLRENLQNQKVNKNENQMHVDGTVNDICMP